MDNLDFQPGIGILCVIEAPPNGNIFACLKDGADCEPKTDGCIQMLSVKDSSAEPTCPISAPGDMSTYVSIQHSDDSKMAKVNDHGTDDLLVITGFAAVAK